jgi:hypothetical protein
LEKQIEGQTNYRAHLAHGPVSIFLLADHVSTCIDAIAY